jgi:glycosyltransferase involved in cell wall biosynthesis
MKFTITGLDEESGSIDSNGNVVGAKGGTEMMREGLFSRVNIPDDINIISSRVREVPKDKKNVLWLHDTWSDPEVQHIRDQSSLDRFEKLVFVSDYQWQTYHLAHQIPYSKSVVLKNAIVPIEEHEKPNDGVINLIYHTTPHRGLELLVPVYEYLWDNGWKDKIHLDVYSSFNIYGWPQRDEQYRELFTKCKEHPGISYHGTVSNDEVREALKKAHIFAYPNIWQETSCIAAMEAMSAGVCIICPNYAALPETTAGFANTYQWHEDTNTHANRFAQLFDAVLNEYWHDQHTQKLQFQKIYANNFFNWDNRAREWSNFLATL